MTLDEILAYLRNRAARRADLNAIRGDDSAARDLEALLNEMWVTIHAAKRAHEPLPEGLDIEQDRYIVAGLSPTGNGWWHQSIRWPLRFATRLAREGARADNFVWNPGPMTYELIELGSLI